MNPGALRRAKTEDINWFPTLPQQKRRSALSRWLRFLIIPNWMITEQAHCVQHGTKMLTRNQLIVFRRICSSTFIILPWLKQAKSCGLVQRISKSTWRAKDTQASEDKPQTKINCHLGNWKPWRNGWIVSCHVICVQAMIIGNGECWPISAICMSIPMLIDISKIKIPKMALTSELIVIIMHWQLCFNGYGAVASGMISPLKSIFRQLEFGRYSWNGLMMKCD